MIGTSVLQPRGTEGNASYVGQAETARRVGIARGRTHRAAHSICPWGRDPRPAALRGGRVGDR